MNISKILGFAFGPVASAAFGLVTVPVIAWAFSPGDVGRFNILQITISFGLLLFVLGLDQAYVREFHESRDQAKLLKACFLPGFVLLVISGVIIGQAFSAQIANLLFGYSDARLFWITLICLISAYVARFLSLILRMEERGLAFSMSQVIPKALMLILVMAIVLMGLTRTFAKLQFVFLISTVAVVATYMWNTRRQWFPALRAPLDAGLERSLFSFGVPLIFSGLAYWGLAATSSLALRSLSTFSELGIYSVSMSFAGVAVIFQSIFSVVWAPIVYKWVAQGDDMAKIADITRQVLAVVCLIIVFCGMFSWLTDFVLPSSYKGVKYLVLCSIVQPLLYTLSEVTCIGMNITRRTILSVWVTIAALVVNVAISAFVVRKYGAAGAAVANSVAYSVFFVARTEASAYVWRRFPRRRLYAFVGCAIALSVATVTIGPSLPFHYALVWAGLLPIVLKCFRREISEMIEYGRDSWKTRFA